MLITIEVADNNRSSTVLEQFENGVAKFGLPSMQCYMLERRGLDRGSIITASSVHNCRVERVHIDVYAGVLCFHATMPQFLTS